MVNGIIKISCLCFLFLLTGCHTTGHNEPRVQTVEVYIPVNQCPANHHKIQKPNRPSLAIENLNEGDINDPGKVAKVYKITVKQLQKYSEELENGFDAYKTICEESQQESSTTSDDKVEGVN